MTRKNRRGLVLAPLILAGLFAACVDTGPERPVAPPMKFERTPQRLERGRYLVENVADCFGCHSQVDWEKTRMPRAGTEGGGGVVPDDTLPFKVYAPNISPDPETGAGLWRDEDFERALRQGIGHDGRTLLPFMPYDFFRNLSDEDLVSIIAYVRSVPAVHHAVPRNEWPEELKKLVKPYPPLTGSVPPPNPADPVKRGAYLVSVAYCAGCHTPIDENFQPLPGLDLAGGQPLYGPWGKVASANLTPDPSGIGHYDEAMFLKTIRTGRANGVRPLNHIMPWEHLRHMTDDDLKAIFAYLRTLKPVKHRVDNTEPPTYCRLCRGTHGLGDNN